ncbi:hypothetical protein [Undibacterium luofuense]|uniref:hypothetical protein n=1 Tax=Undibacterium luofuense TaxID=2828733 RepID=UPI0030ECD760
MIAPLRNKNCADEQIIADFAGLLKISAEAWIDSGRTEDAASGRQQHGLKSRFL